MTLPVTTTQPNHHFCSQGLDTDDEFEPLSEPEDIEEQLTKANVLRTILPYQPLQESGSPCHKRICKSLQEASSSSSSSPPNARESNVYHNMISPTPSVSGVTEMSTRSSAAEKKAGDEVGDDGPPGLTDSESECEPAPAPSKEGQNKRKHRFDHTKRRLRGKTPLFLAPGHTKSTVTSAEGARPPNLEGTFETITVPTIISEEMRCGWSRN